ncbi:glycosyltransferase, partial [human gut metagenome]
LLLVWRKKLPKSVEDCIKTWKKFLPDYEIKQWDESNFDVNSFPFVKEAYESKKWAFVSDYVRIYALYNEGGLYLDTDVKILKNPTDVLNKEVVLGYEDSGYVGTAMIYAQNPQNKYIKAILDYYGKIKHFEPEIMYNFANPVIITKILKQYESKVNEEGIRIFDDNIYVYPRDYFYPINYNYSEKVYTKNTCMVHLFKATWTDRGEKRTIGIYRTFGPALGKTLNSIIDGIFNFKTSIIVTLKKIYSWARMKASIYITRSRRVKRITNEINQIQKDFITICHPEMPVEKNEIQNLIEGSILELREQYTKKEAEMIASAIANSGKKQILFNQYADGWDMLISSIKKQKLSMKVKMIIHNGQEDLTDAIIWDNFDNILGMYDKGLIDELVFLKKSVYEFYKEKGYRAKLLSKYVEIENRES